MKIVLMKILNWLVVAAVPVVITAAVIRLLLTPIFTTVEYQLPHFPEDEYGFTQEERLLYGNLTRRYLVSGGDIQELRDLRFESGEPLYLERELSHLVDVKQVLGGLFSAAWAAAAVLFAAGLISHRAGEWHGFLGRISWGGWLTAGLLLALLILSLLSFNTFFTRFHEVFFEGDSWLFRYSDTLIRLFPIQFWQDVFLVFGVLTVGTGLLVGWLLPKKKHPVSPR